eukprot:365707-Chlamydomonas_euryale.AAC.7
MSHNLPLAFSTAMLNGCPIEAHDTAGVSQKYESKGTSARTLVKCARKSALERQSCRTSHHVPRVEPSAKVKSSTNPPFLSSWHWENLIPHILDVGPSQLLDAWSRATRD